jgi:hypothetical protein
MMSIGRSGQEDIRSVGSCITFHHYIMIRLCSSQVKRLFIAALTCSLLALPLTQVEAAPVPCERGHIPVGSGESYRCVSRREFNALRGQSSLRRYERYQANLTRRTQKKEVVKERSFATRFAGVRNRSRAFNPFSLREPQSRRYNPGEKTVSTNLRRMIVRQRRAGPAVSRTLHAPAAQWTRRTKQQFFNANEDPTKSLRTRRGY